VLEACPVLWESMLLILILKCMHLTMCAVVSRIMTIRPKRDRGALPLDLIMHFVFFINECVTTSRSLNSPECISAVGSSFGGGHPLLIYVNGISCVWDGCYILACALFELLR